MALVVALLLLPAGSAPADPSAAGTISTLVGDPTVPAAATTVAQEPMAVAVSPADDSLYVADPSTHSVREVNVATGLEATIAGDGNYGSSGDGGPASEAEFEDPGGLAGDSAGNVLISDRYTELVRLVAAESCTSDCPYGLAAMTKGDIYTIAGNGTAGYSGDGGPATSAELLAPGSLALDSAGDVLIGDALNQRIRLVAAESCTSDCPYGLAAMTQGDIYTIAGNGTAGFSGDGGPATSAELHEYEEGLAVDSAGDVLISDTVNRRIRLVAAENCTSDCPYGLAAMTKGDIYTIAGNGSYGLSGDGGPATNAELAEPGGLAVDSAGNLLVSDLDNQRIRLVAAENCTSDCPYGLAAMTKGDIYTVAGDGSAGFSGDGGSATNAELKNPTGLAVDSAGDLLIGDRYNDRIRLVAATSCANGCPYGLAAATKGDIYTIAGDGTTGFSGDGGPAAPAELRQPGGLAVDNAGNLFIGDANNERVRLVAVESCTGNCPFGLVNLTKGDIYTIAGNGTEGFSGDGGLATSAALHTPNGLAVDGADDVLISERLSQRIRLIASESCMSDCPYGLANMTKGFIYTIAGNGGAGFSGDGGIATHAELDNPTGLAVDSAGNLLISDTSNQRVRLVAGQNCTSYCPYGLPALTKGDIYTIAGTRFEGFSGDDGPATNAELNNPTGLAVDKDGDLLISDLDNQRIRLVAAKSCPSGCPYGLANTTRGDIYTVVGTGSEGIAGDGGPATAAQLSYPSGLAVDSAGDLLISDLGNQRIRLVAAESCTSGCGYGLTETTTGNIYTVAGDGKEGFSGDGGPATSAEISIQGTNGLVSGVAVDSSGDLLISDIDNNRVRSVTGGGAAPAFTAATPPESALAGSDLEYTFSASGSPSPTYALAPGAPSWLTINPASGRLTGTVPVGTADFSYLVTATNSFGSRTAGPFFTAAATPVSVTGTVKYGEGEVVPAGAIVDACLSNGGLCYSTLTNPSGGFSVSAIPGTTIVLKAYPPQSHSDVASGGSEPILVPSNGVQGETITLDTLAPLLKVTFNELPGGSLLAWTAPTRVSVTGCAGGLAVLTVTGTNGVTGILESNIEALPESPSEPGTYSGVLPPLAPIHGEGEVERSVSCPPQSALLPSLGPASGGNPVVVSGSGFTGATSVGFGDAPASSYRVLSAEDIEAIAPPGTGTVPVTVDGPNVTNGSVAVDEYTYLAVNSVSPSSGPSEGGTTVTITGTGLEAVTAVNFGDRGARFTPISSTEVRAVSPPGEDTADITVETAWGGTTPITGVDQFNYGVGMATRIGSNSVDSSSRLAPPSNAPRSTNLDKPRAASPGALGEEALSSSLATPFLVDAGIKPHGTKSIELGLPLGNTVEKIVKLGYMLYAEGKLGSKIGEIYGMLGLAGLSGVDQCSPAGKALEEKALQLELKPLTSSIGSGIAAALEAAVGLALGPEALPVAELVAPIVGRELAKWGMEKAIELLVDKTREVSCKKKWEEEEKSGRGSGGGSGGGSGSGNGSEGFQPNVLIDPSGTVLDTNGAPVDGATVTILRSESWRGPFVAVDVEAPGIEPAENPETTRADGVFHWEVDSGFYEVQASAPGCTATGEPGQNSATVGPYPVPPPQVGLTITLACPDEAPAPAPSVESLSESTGPASGGTTVTMIGSGFTPSSTVTFGATPASTVTYLGPEALRVVSPPGDGPVAVFVHSAGGTSPNSPADQFFYGSPPTVSGLSVHQGPAAGGTRITVFGSGFTGASTVDFGGVPGGSLEVKSDGELEVTAPEGPRGVVDVEVITPAGANEPTAADQYTYLPPPPVCAPVSLSVPAESPTTVSLSCAGEEVIYDSPQAPSHGALSQLNSSSGTILYTPTPGYSGPDSFTYTAHNAGGTSAPSSVTITVTPAPSQPTQGEARSAAATSTVNAAVPAPTVERIRPDHGRAHTEVLVIGSGFAHVSAVDFGAGHRATFSVRSPSRIAAVAPSERAGATVDITVTTPGGRSKTSHKDRFTYARRSRCSHRRPRSRRKASASRRTASGTGGQVCSTHTGGRARPLRRRSLRHDVGNASRAGQLSTSPVTRAAPRVKATSPTLVLRAVCQFPGGFPVTRKA